MSSERSSLRALLVLVCAAVLVDEIFFTALTPLIPHYSHVLGLSKTQIGVLVAAYPLGTLLVALPSGVLVARIGSRQVLAIGLTLMSVTALLFGFQTHPLVLDAVRFVQGMGGSLTWAGALSWLTNAAPVERRGAVLGTAFSAAVAGTLLGPVFGVIAVKVGLGSAFASVAVVGMVLVAGCFVLPAPPLGERQGLRRLAKTLGDRGVAGGMWLTLLAGLGIGSLGVLVPLRFDQLGAGAVVIGGAFAGAAAVEAMLAPAIGRLSDRRGRLMTVQLSLVAAVIFTLLLPVVGVTGLLVALVVIGTPSFGTLFVPSLAMITDGADRRGMNQGLSMGLANLSWAVGQAGSASASGALAQVTTDTLPFVILTAVCVLTLLAVRPRGRRRIGQMEFWLPH